MARTMKLLLLLAACIALCRSVTVKTTSGPVKGQTLTLNDGARVNTFLGVPFAKPPTGLLRWKPPVSPEPWTKTLEANRLRSACEQSRVGIVWLTHLFWDDYSEDCLHLNIYTPADMAGGPYPVVVWFYGGGFKSGANFQYPGHFLAARGVIVVVPNYRLGVLGFASTGDAASPGNYGLLDQQMALRFVRANVKQFGGDPARVTIAGQSAGGASVGIHTLMPSSKGLFQQAVLQSGADVGVWAVQGRDQRPYNYTYQVAREVGCPTNDHARLMDCLRQVPADLLVDIGVTCTPGFVCLGFGPVVDGDVVPDMPLALRRAGRFTKVPTMLGLTAQDGSLGSLLAGDNALEEGLSRDEFLGVIRNVTGYLLTGHPERADAVYRALRLYYSPWGQRDDKPANREQMNNLVTDVAFGFPADIVTRFTSKEAPTFSYVMDYRSSNASELLPEWLGVVHAMELPYTWGYPFITRNAPVLAETKFTHDIFDWNTEDDNMANFMMDLWTNFIKTGNPTPNPVELPGNEPMTWRRYDDVTRQTLAINRKLGHVSRFRQGAYALFREYLPYLILD